MKNIYLGNQSIMTTGDKTYIDLLPQMDISRILLSTTSASIERFLEQHFWYSGNCNPDDEIIIEFEHPSSSCTIDNPIMTIKISELLDIRQYPKRVYYSADNNYFNIKYASKPKYLTFRNSGQYAQYIRSSSFNIKSITSNISGSIMLFISDNSGSFKSGFSTICIYFDKNKLLGIHQYFYESQSDYENLTASSTKSIYLTPVIVNIHD